MLPIPDEMPHTKEEYEYLINATYQNGLEKYENECAQARAEAEAQWERELPQKRERLIAQMEAKLNAQFIQTPKGPKPLSEAQWKTAWNVHIKEIDEHLANEEKQFIDNYIVGVETPETREQIEATYSIYKPQDESEQEQLSDNVPISFYDYYYRLADGRVYSVADAAFVQPRNGQYVIDIPGGTVDDLKELLKFYRDKKDGYPLVVIGPELQTLEELKQTYIQKINKQTKYNIESGFVYAIAKNKSYYFSFKEDDQINFGNMANSCILLQNAGVTEEIEWQAWTQPEHDGANVAPVVLLFNPSTFLDFYTRGAMAHLHSCLQTGRALKDEVRKATNKAAIVSMAMPETDVTRILEAK